MDHVRDTECQKYNYVLVIRTYFFLNNYRIALTFGQERFCRVNNENMI